MPAPPPLRAQAQVPATANIAAIIQAAGGDPFRAVYDRGVLHVPGVAQAALDEAVSELGDPTHSLRTDLVAAALIEMRKRIDAGIPWSGKVVQIDEASQNRLSAAHSAARAGVLPSGFFWMTKDNTALALDPPEVEALAAAALGHVFALRAHYWALRSQILAAPDAEGAEAVALTTGWPEPPASPEA